MPGSTGQAIEIANRGQIRFYRKSPQSCSVKLTISYELPDVLVPFGNVSVLHPTRFPQRNRCNMRSSRKVE